MVPYGTISLYVGKLILKVQYLALKVCEPFTIPSYEGPIVSIHEALKQICMCV